MSAGKKAVREKFRTDVLKRDGNRCRMCRRNDCKLDVHHITDRSLMPNGGYVKENGITLCDVPGGCHAKAERFHISAGTDFEPGMHPDDLYRIIGSSAARAWAAAERG